MRIFVLNYEFPPVGGGGGRASADLCKVLSRRGHEVQVLTARTPGLPAHEKVDGYQVRRVRSGRRSRFKASFPAMAGYILGGWIPGLRLVRAWQPDLMHVHFAVPTGALAYGLHRFTGVPYVLTAHLGDVPGAVPEKTSRWFRFVEPFTPPIWAGASAVAAVSEYTKELAHARYDVDIEVVPNGIEMGKLKAPQGAHSPPRLVFAGRFQPQKNLHFLLETLAELRDLAWECKLIGDGPERKSLERAAREFDLADRITFTGWVEPERAEAELAESDLLVMPSRSEGLPVVAVQALAHGVAIAASQSGGLAELVEDGRNGISCPVGDRSCFVEGLRRCLQDRERLAAMKRASRELAAPYDLERVADRYLQIFERVLAS